MLRDNLIDYPRRQFKLRYAGEEAQVAVWRDMTLFGYTFMASTTSEKLKAIASDVVITRMKNAIEIRVK